MTEETKNVRRLALPVYIPAIETIYREGRVVAVRSLDPRYRVTLSEKQEPGKLFIDIANVHDSEIEEKVGPPVSKASKGCKEE